MKKLLYFLLGFITLFSCDNREFLDESDIKTAFPFEFLVEPTQNYYLETIGDINLTISNSKEIKDQDYIITYTIIGGKGEIFAYEVLTNKTFSMKKGNFKIGFKGYELGDYRIVFTASNGKSEYDVTKEISIKVGYRPFEVNFDLVSEMFITETTPFGMDLSIANSGSITYKWLWSSAQNNEITENGNLILKDQKFNILPNQKLNGIFNPKEIRGIHTLLFNYQDSQGQQMTFDKEVLVKDIDFQASLIAVDREIYFGETARMNFSFVPEFISKVNPNEYKLQYSLDADDGILSINGENLLRGEEINLTEFPFQNKEIVFEPTNPLKRTSKLILTITDRYGYTKDVEISINVLLKPFELFTSKQTTSYVVPNEPTGGRFNLEVRSTADFEKMKYKVRIVSTSDDSDNGYFELNGVRYEYNQDIPLTGQYTNLIYYPTAYGSGKHTFSFQASDVANQSPTNQVPSMFFDIYQKLEIKRLIARYTLQQIRNGTVLRPSRWEIKSYLDFELVGTSKIKSIQIIGTEFGRPFDEMVGQAQISQIINNTMSNLPLKQGQFNHGRTAVHKEGDPLKVIFTDENGYTTEGTAYFVEQRI